MALRFEDVFAIFTVIIGTIGLIPYYIGIFKGTVKPHLFSWLVWSLVNGIVAAVQLAENGGVGAWTTAIGAVQLFIVAVLAAMGYGTRNLTRSDAVCFGLALAAIPLWHWTKNPLWSVLLLCFIDGMAFMPTFRKSWTAPHQEKIFTYLVGNLKYILSLFALETLTFNAALFPLWVIFLDTLLIAMLIWRRSLIHAERA